VQLKAFPLKFQVKSLDNPAEDAAFRDVAVRSDEVAEEDQACGHGFSGAGPLSHFSGQGCERRDSDRRRGQPGDLVQSGCQSMGDTRTLPTFAGHPDLQ
jgi:hypothetical protein